MTSPHGVAIILFGSLASSAALSAEGVTTCSAASPIAAGATVNSYVVVPEGATCEVTGIKVIGNVMVGKQATLRVHGATITGNIEAAGCAEMMLRGERAPLLVGGDIQIRGCTGRLDYGNLWVAGFIDGSSGRALVAGDIECVGNTGLCAIYKADVGGNIRVDYNTASGTPGQNSISANITSNLVGKKLECNNNNPKPVTFGANIAARNMLGQCATGF